MSTNTEAFEGMREMEQIVRPMREILQMLQRQLAEENQRLQQYFEQLREEKRPRQLEKQLREAEKEYTKALNKQIEKCAINGYPEMADKLTNYVDLMQRNIESNIEHIKGNAWVGQSYDQELRDASKELSTMLSMQRELAQDNKALDYSRTAQKMDAIAQNSPILTKSGVVTKDYDRDYVGKLPASEKVMDKKLEKAAPAKPAKEKSEFAKRLEEAVKEARKLSAAKAAAPAKDLGSRAADAMERVL